MNKVTTLSTILSVGMMFFAAKGMADENDDSDLYEQFNQLSQAGLKQETNPFASSSAVFIQQELSEQLTELKARNSSIADPKGQWSVSFDLNRLGLGQSDWSLSNSNSENSQTNFDWALGTSLVSPDKTSRFYVNYGKRKVPISISFDDSAFLPELSQDSVGLGLEQSLSESWAVSISYQKSQTDLAPISSQFSDTELPHQLNYLFDFDNTNRLETVNFSPFSHNLASSFMDDISAIQIKVSRKLSDDLTLSAKASQSQGNIGNTLSPNLLDVNVSNQYYDQQLSIEGQYRVSESWLLGANLEHQVTDFNNSVKSPFGTGSDSFNHLDSTTLDIGVQYQSSWDQVGVVIRIDLMNLLGVRDASSEQLGLDGSGLKPFSFDTPKQIKVSGSINF